MAACVLPYSPERYNTLPNIDVAAQHFLAGTMDRVAEAVGSVFIKHQFQDTFGLVLLHKHFEIHETEILLHVGSVAVPCSENHLATLDRKIQPSAWIITADGLVPYEYCDAVGETFVSVSSLPFVSELWAILDQFGLTDKIGLCRLFEHDLNSKGTQFEFTQGRANITLPFDVFEGSTNGASIEAVWQFGLAVGQGMDGVRSNVVDRAN